MGWLRNYETFQQCHMRAFTKRLTSLRMTRRFFQKILTNNSDKCFASTTFLRRLSHWDDEITLYPNVLFHQSAQLHVATQPWHHISYGYLLIYVAVVKDFRRRLILNSQRTECRIRQNATRIHFEVCYDHDIALCKCHHHQFILSAWILMKVQHLHTTCPIHLRVLFRRITVGWWSHQIVCMVRHLYQISELPSPSCYCECFNGIY